MDLVRNTAQLLPEGIWKNNTRILCPIHTGLLCWPVCWSHTEGHAVLLSAQGLAFPALGGFGRHSGPCGAPPAAVTIPTAAGAEHELCFLSHPLPAKSQLFTYVSTPTGWNFLPNSAEGIFTFRCPIPFPSQISVLESFETAENSKHLLRVLCLFQTCEWTQNLNKGGEVRMKQSQLSGTKVFLLA